ncbi:hypothetical protein Cflav_PD0846 [Pedosphaera parvula Ellin514]|uniref:Uncharacterized protein n=1 Tax=Pedosphaera parvula (strain Ellin514) TaxID=320771 RepID=B9XQH1_PEDPL|nr:hypothetical protein Cflav_PD0846 [Pedosphaera parvula Ellin514]
MDSGMENGQLIMNNEAGNLRKLSVSDGRLKFNTCMGVRSVLVGIGRQ